MAAVPFAVYEKPNHFRSVQVAPLVGLAYFRKFLRFFVGQSDCNTHKKGKGAGAPRGVRVFAFLPGIPCTYRERLARR